MDFSLQDKKAIVCGGTDGIGKATAFELAKLGAKITVIARNENKLKDLIIKLNNMNELENNYICVDFNNPDELKIKLANNITEPVHILINNTGGPPGGPITDASIEEFKNAFSNHLICNHILAQSVIEGMKSEKYGRIINIVSTSVKQPIKGLGVSNTTRGAVASWAKTLAGELAEFNITVNNVLPGATKTGRLNSIFNARAKRFGKTVEEIAQEFLKEIPAKRFAEPEEVAYAIVFLASPLASYITGHSLPVDGGRIQSL